MKHHMSTRASVAIVLIALVSLSGVSCGKEEAPTVQPTTVQTARPTLVSDPAEAKSGTGQIALEDGAVAGESPRDLGEQKASLFHGV